MGGDVRRYILTELGRFYPLYDDVRMRKFCQNSLWPCKMNCSKRVLRHCPSHTIYILNIRIPLSFTLEESCGIVRVIPYLPYCPFDISWKDVFRLAFYFKWKAFVLTDHILSETICLFNFCVLFPNIYTKIKFTAKSCPDLCNFYSKVIFWKFCLRKYFLLSFAEFELLMFHKNIVKISEKLIKWN